MNYFVIINGQQSGPHSPDELRTMGITRQTPVWTDGMSDWKPAGEVETLSFLFDTRPPQPNSYQAYTNPQPRNTNSVIPHTNWLPWAIVGTILALFTSCIGLIFGIIGIVKASQANEHFAMGNEDMAIMANSTARIMTIITLVLDGIAIIVSCFMFTTYVGVLSSLV